MRFLVVSAAFIASTVAFIAALAIGLFLAGVDESGMRGTGLLLAGGAVVAYAAALLIIVGPPRLFRGRGRVLAWLAALIAIVPLLAISGAALSVSGNPLGSTAPTLEYPAFAAGVLLAVGAAALVRLAVSKPRGARPATLPGAAPQVERSPEQGPPSRRADDDDEEEVRVIAG